jgi:hypothetical protein
MTEERNNLQRQIYATSTVVTTKYKVIGSLTKAKDPHPSLLSLSNFKTALIADVIFVASFYASALFAQRQDSKFFEACFLDIMPLTVSGDPLPQALFKIYEDALETQKDYKADQLQMFLDSLRRYNAKDEADYMEKIAEYNSGVLPMVWKKINVSKILWTLKTRWAAVCLKTDIRTAQERKTQTGYDQNEKDKGF